MKLPVRAAAAPIRCVLMSATLGLSGAAMAQSSVTIFGAADAGIGKIEYGDNPGAKKTQMIAGSLMNHATSHVGLHRGGTGFYGYSGCDSWRPPPR